MKIPSLEVENLGETYPISSNSRKGKIYLSFCLGTN